MPIENIKILTSESLDNLRNEVIGDKKLILEPFDFLVEKFQLQTVEHVAKIDTDLKLDPIHASDIPNMLLLSNAIQGLTPELATDERLWVSLALGQFHDYSFLRWGNKAKTEDDLFKYWRLHVLAASTRNRWRDHSVSRLWWMHRYASMLQPENPKAALEMLLIEIDFISVLLSKPSVSTNANLARAIVLVSQDEILNKKHLAFSRENFRDFVKELDLIGGRRLLSALSEEELTSIVRDQLKAKLPKK